MPPDDKGHGGQEQVQTTAEAAEVAVFEERRKNMDTGEGRFEQFSSIDHKEFLERMYDLRDKYPKSKGVFTVGETLEIRGSKFKVTDISPWGIKLRLLKADEPCPLDEPE